LFAPIMTPFWMKVLAGTYVEVEFIPMCIQIIKIVIVPIGEALLFDALNKGSEQFKKRMGIMVLLTVIWFVAISFSWTGLSSGLSRTFVEIIILLNFLIGAVLFGYLFYHLNRMVPRLLKLMPFMSMVGIVYF